VRSNVNAGAAGERAAEGPAVPDRRLAWFCALLAPVLAWSAVRPHDYFTWFLEIAPVFAGLPLALALHRRFPLSSLLLVLLWWHCVILIVGGHYTYARVPLGEWAKAWFGWTRNDYDKLGHFAQGFVPAILAREILLRTSPLGNSGGGRPSRWLGFLVVCVCLAFSAFYELVEWAVAVSSGAAADDFLGTQGDPWDTQTDMGMALVGAVLAVLLMPRWHDWSLKQLAARRFPLSGER
jgi:putative membrane protein